MKGFVPATVLLTSVCLCQAASADSSTIDRKFGRGHLAVTKSIVDVGSRRSEQLPAELQRLLADLSAPLTNSRPSRMTFESAAGVRSVLQVDIQDGMKKLRVLEFGTGRVRGDWVVASSATPEQRETVAVDVVGALGLFPANVRRATPTESLPKPIN